MLRYFRFSTGFRFFIFSSYDYIFTSQLWFLNYYLLRSPTPAIIAFQVSSTLLDDTKGKRKVCLSCAIARIHVRICPVDACQCLPKFRCVAIVCFEAGVVDACFPVGRDVFRRWEMYKQIRAAATIPRRCFMTSTGEWRARCVRVYAGDKQTEQFRSGKLGRAAEATRNSAESDHTPNDSFGCRLI